ncbi:unnamed protein product [Rangifer tarandus platyrhynchus]|uniref:Uncharacterized protein n=2 Tax=Rangifer tarandus platyrhynchus TaxID=3082113 RepID=A0ACB0FE32_RANTA|nr:unnamed protein product [Rangifer tarandus platyrhynchus]CAI9711255.1 unnamed protein product [Rangifer tarandus platyrhynchus]
MLCASSTRDTERHMPRSPPGTRLKQALRDQGQLQEVAWSAYLVTLPLSPEPEWPLPGRSTCCRVPLLRLQPLGSSGPSQPPLLAGQGPETSLAGLWLDSPALSGPPRFVELPAGLAQGVEGR